MITKITLSLLFLVFTFDAYNQDKWELQKEKNGIKVYTQAVSGSNLKAFKSVTNIKTDIENLVAVCKDVSAFPEWQDATFIAELLKTKGETEHIHYLQFSAPWPVCNRDNITQFKYSFNPADHSVRVDISTLPGYLPEKEGVVRIKKSSGYYLFTPQADGMVEVTHSAHADPAGSIPAWLANSAVIDTPFKTLNNLKQQVKKPEYQGKSYAFMRK